MTSRGADFLALVVGLLGLLTIVAIVVDAVSIQVTSSRAECERANPGKVCGIVWLPVNPSQP